MSCGITYVHVCVVCDIHWQVGISWYFGNTDRTPPQIASDGLRWHVTQAVPVNVGPRMGHTGAYRTHHLRRSLVSGSPTQVTLLTTAESEQQPRFGKQKCHGGDAAGRWIYRPQFSCQPPYCTGDPWSPASLENWVRVHACVSVRAMWP